MMMFDKINKSSKTLTEQEQMAFEMMNDTSPLLFDQSIISNQNQMGSSYNTQYKVSMDEDEEDPFSFKDWEQSNLKFTWN